MNNLLFTNLTSSTQFRTEFKKKIKESDNLIIASGYFGSPALIEFESDLIDIAARGSCKILLGMIFHAGISHKQQELLHLINTKIRAANSESGIFISIKPYHGKIYQFQNTQKKLNDLYIGSSNFSKEGFASRNECTAYIDNQYLKKEVSSYLNILFDKNLARRIEEVELRSRNLSIETRPSKLLEDYKINQSVFPDINKVLGVCPIKLRVDEQPQSGLNLYFGKGRVNQNKKYVTRPWYEIEIGTEKDDRDNIFYPLTKANSKKDGGKSKEGKFTAYAEDENKFYKFEMSVFADYGKNIATAEESGGRETLGKFIKGKLERRGLLKEGDVITSEILIEYGNDSLELHKLNDKEYILKF